MSEPWEDYAGPASPSQTQPTEQGPWSDFGNSQEQQPAGLSSFIDKIGPAVNQFVGNLGRTAVEHVVQNMAETGEVPSLFGYAKSVGQTEYQNEAEASKKTVAGLIKSQVPQDIQDYSGLYKQNAQTVENTPDLNSQDLFNKSVMEGPTGTAFNLMEGPLIAPIAPLFNIGVEAAEKSGVNRRAIDSAMSVLTILGVVHAGGVKGPTADGLAGHVIGEPENVAMDGAQPSDIMRNVASNAVPETAEGQARAARMEAQRGLVNTEAGESINDRVRRMAPDLFQEKDRLDARQSILRDNITNADETFGKDYDEQKADLEQQREPYTRAPTDLEGDALHAAIQENTKSVEGIDSQLRDLGSRDDYIKKAMDQARDEIGKNDYRLRDLAPEVNRAYETAHEVSPDETAQNKIQTPESEPEQPVVAPHVEEPAQQEPINANISAAVSKDLQKLGRPAEEADAAGALIAAHYQARAARFGGKKGTAEEMYTRDAPELRQGKDRGAVAKELAQPEGKELEQKARGKYRLATSDAQSLITLMKRADPSTFIHETGHHWLEELMGDAKDADAPEDIIQDAKKVRDYLGLKEGEDLTTAQHEKFARSFERYMRDGIAPSKTLADVFAKFKQWLTAVYKVLNERRFPINEQIRGVFDRLLASKPERTIIAPDDVPGKALADIHEVDANTTPPEHKAEVADTVRSEIDHTAKANDKGIYDALKSAESNEATSNSAESASSAEANAAIAGSASTDNGIARESGAVAGSGSEVETGSGGTQQPDDAAGSAVAGVDNTVRTDAAGRAGTNQPSGRGKSKLVDPKGNIRWENLTSDEAITDTALKIAEQNGYYEGARGKPITQRDISDYADSIGVEEKEINLDKIEQMTRTDGIPLAFRIRSVRQMLVQSAARIKDMWANAADWSDEDVLSYAKAKSQHIRIAQILTGVSAEWGRAGSAFRDISGQAVKEGVEISELLQSTIGRSVDQLRQEGVLASKLKTPKQQAKYIKETAKPDFIDKMLEYRNNCLLSGPVTHAVYFNANIVNLATRPIERYVAGKISEVSGATDRVYTEEAGEMAYSILNTNAFKNAMDSWNERRQILPGSENSKYTSLAPQVMEPKGVLGTALSQIPRTIGSLHSFVYTLGYEQNIAALSYRTARNEGLTPNTDAFAKRLADLRADQPQEMRDQASADALKEVNMGKTGEWLGKLSLLVNSYRATKFLFPFIKMEINAKKNAFLERTPLGYLNKEIRSNLLGLNGEAARDIQRGKIVANTAIAATLFTVASQYINGSGPTNPNKNRVWRLTHVPDSVQIGSISFELKNLARLGEMLKFGAGIHESVEGWEGDDGDRIAAATHSLMDGGFTSNLKDMLDVIEHPHIYGGKFIQNFAASFVPFSVGAGQVAKLIDPTARDTKTEGETGLFSSVEGIFKTAKARVPFWSETLEPKVDMFGHLIQDNSDYHGLYANDPVVQRMEALHMGIGVLKPEMFGVKLDAEQYARFGVIAGKMAKDSLDKVVVPGFERQPPAAQIKAIQETVSAARDAARQIMLHDDGDLLQKVNSFQRLAHQ